MSRSKDVRDNWNYLIMNDDPLARGQTTLRLGIKINQRNVLRTFSKVKLLNLFRRMSVLQKELTESTFLHRSSRGNQSQVSTVVTHGNVVMPTKDIPNDVWNFGGVLEYLDSAETMNIQSTSVNDTTGGTGARTVRIIGLNDDFNEIQEDVELDGVTPFSTGKSYLRILLMIVISSGSSQTNEGGITATSDISGLVQRFIGVGNSISHNSHFTVPRGKRLLVLQYDMNITELTGAPSRVLISQQVKPPGSNTWLVMFQRQIDTRTSNNFNIEQRVCYMLNEGTDIRLQALASTDSVEVHTRTYYFMSTINTTEDENKNSNFPDLINIGGL